MTKEFSLIVSLAVIAGGVVLGVGFSTGFFHPEPLRSPDGLPQREAAIVAAATSKDAPSLMQHAQDHLALGEYKEALVFLRVAAHLNPKDVGVQKTLAAAAFKVNNMTLAANTSYTLTQIDPKDMDARLSLAKALYALDRMPDAAATCRVILTHAPLSSPFRKESLQILQRIPYSEQRKVPDTIFPIISAD